MKVYILAGDAFEARDLGRSLGLNPRDVIICNSVVVVEGRRFNDGDLILQTASAPDHPEHRDMVRALESNLVKSAADVRWEKEAK